MDESNNKVYTTISNEHVKALFSSTNNEMANEDIDRIVGSATRHSITIDLNTESFQRETAGCIKFNLINDTFAVIDISLEPIGITSSEISIPLLGCGLQQGRYVAEMYVHIQKQENEILEISNPYTATVYATDESQLIAQNGGGYYATSRVSLHMGYDENLNEMSLTNDRSSRLVESGEFANVTSEIDFDNIWSIHRVNDRQKCSIDMTQVVSGIMFLRNILESMDGDKAGSEKKHARKTPYRRKDSGNVKTNSITLANGPITNALMGRNSGCIPPDVYFLEDSVKVDTGGGGFAMVDVRTSEQTDIDEAYKEYRLNDRDRFWLDALYTLAIEEDKRTIEGSEILRNRGYANPYAESSAAAMTDAFRSINKAVSTRIGIDVREEKRNRRKNRAKLTGSIRLQPVVNATIDIDTYDDENKIINDFTINIQTANPIDSLPLAKYERDRGMFTTATANDFMFESVKKLTTDDRQMWSYVLRVINSKTLKGTILFDTMWRNLELREPEINQYAYVDKSGRPLSAPLKEGGIPISPEFAEMASDIQIEQRRRDAVRKQHERMLKKLEKMLNEKQSKGKTDTARKESLLQSWSYNKDADGRINGIKIRRKTGSAASKKN